MSDRISEEIRNKKNKYMEIILIIGIVVIIGLLTTVIFLLYGKGTRDKFQDTSLDSLKMELKDIRQEMKGSLENNLIFLQKQTSSSEQTIKEVYSNIEQLKATNKQVVDFASQLHGLDRILRNPKHRGVWGEQALESLLQNFLPVGTFQMQYSFKDGNIVDAVIFDKEKIIPIDAKFSLEKFNRLMDVEENERETLEKDFKKDVKLRIDETSKYVKPNEGTTPFALMFIPAEGVYQNLLNSKIGTLSVNSQDLINYAYSKKVLIVSPNTFFAYLQTVKQSLKDRQTEESIKDVLKNISILQKHLITYEEYFKKLGIQMKTTANTYNTAYKEFAKIDKDFVRLTGGEKTVDPMKLDGPNIE